MKKQRLTNGQVLIGFILFILVMGIVGKLDHDSQMDVAADVVRYRTEMRADDRADKCTDPAVRLAGAR
jgi:hypothetical protein